MQVSKIFFSGVDAKVQNNEIKTDVTKNSNSHIDEKKSNTAKYMIGATALAAAVAVGIIGHKNNWWRKAADAADDVSRKGSETLENAEKNTPNISDLANDIQYSDFSKIEGETYEIQGFKYKDLKNSEGKKIKTFVSDDGKRIVSTLDFNPETDKPIKIIAYHDSGKTVALITELDPLTGKPSKAFSYDEDGKTLNFVIDYDPTTGKQLKITYYEEDGKTVDSVIDYDPTTGKQLKATYYDEDGKTLVQ